MQRGGIGGNLTLVDFIPEEGNQPEKKISVQAEFHRTQKPSAESVKLDVVEVLNK